MYTYTKSASSQHHHGNYSTKHLCLKKVILWVNEQVVITLCSMITQTVSSGCIIHHLLLFQSNKMALSEFVTVLQNMLELLLTNGFVLEYQRTLLLPTSEYNVC